MDAICRSRALLVAGGWYYNGGTQYDLWVNMSVLAGTYTIFRCRAIRVPDGVSKIRIAIAASMGVAVAWTWQVKLTNIDSAVVYWSPSWIGTAFTARTGSSRLWYEAIVTLPGGNYMLELLATHSNPGTYSIAMQGIHIRPEDY